MQSDSVTYYNISFFLEQATLTVEVAMYKQSQTIPFAGYEVNIPDNGIKYNVVIQDWIFETIANTLTVTLSSSSNSDLQTFTTGTDQNGNLQWMRLSVCAIGLYSTYLAYAVLDGTVQRVQFKTTGNNSDIAVRIPHFWNYAVIDPEYSVLVETGTSCQPNKHNNIPSEVIVSVVVSIVSATTIMAGVWFVIVSKRRSKARDAIKKRISDIQEKEAREQTKDRRKKTLGNKQRPSTQKEQYLQL